MPHRTTVNQLKLKNNNTNFLHDLTLPAISTEPLGNNTLPTKKIFIRDLIKIITYN